MGPFGPLTVQSVGGKMYYLVVMDDYSGPLTVQSVCGKMYYLVIIDDYS